MALQADSFATANRCRGEQRELHRHSLSSPPQEGQGEVSKIFNL
jgi:hypothetical protein